MEKDSRFLSDRIEAALGGHFPRATRFGIRSDDSAMLVPISPRLSHKVWNTY